MAAATFHLFPVVEGHGEVDAVPRLLHRIWNSDKYELRVERPYRIPLGSFINKTEKRRECMSVVMRRCMPHLPDSGIVLLMDADSPCCKNFLQGEQMRAIQKDITDILGGNGRHFFALAEKEYESWLVAGFGGDGRGDPCAWLTKNRNICGLSGRYNKIPGQLALTQKIDLDMAREKNPSFRRFCARVSALAGREAD